MQAVAHPPKPVGNGAAIAPRADDRGRHLVAESYDDGAPIAPNDAADLPGGACRALLITTSGPIVVVTLAGSVITIPALPVGTELRLRVSRVKATGTTGGALALY